MIIYTFPNEGKTGKTDRGYEETFLEIFTRPSAPSVHEKLELPCPRPHPPNRGNFAYEGGTSRE